MVVAVAVSYYTSRHDAREAAWRPGKLPWRQLMPVVVIDALVSLAVYVAVTVVKSITISLSVSDERGLATVWSILLTAGICGVAALPLLVRKTPVLSKKLTSFRERALADVTSAMARSESKDHEENGAPALARWDKVKLVRRVRQWCNLSSIDSKTTKLLVQCATDGDFDSHLALCGHLYKLQDKRGPEFLDQLIKEAPSAA